MGQKVLAEILTRGRDFAVTNISGVFFLPPREGDMIMSQLS